MAKSNTEKQKDFKKRQRERGLVPFYDWIQPDRKPKLREMAKKLRESND